MLSTGVEIWDFAGNVFEWVSDDVSINFATNNFWPLITIVSSPVVGTIGGLTGTVKVLFGLIGSFLIFKQRLLTMVVSEWAH